MSKQKYHYYIGVIRNDGTVRLVTDIHYQSKSCEWKEDGKPLAVKKSIAEDLVFGLCMNFRFAFIVTSYVPIEFQFRGESNES